MIVLGSDHVGYALKRRVTEYLDKRGIAYFDVGVDDGERGDYPAPALKAARAVASGEAEKGLLFCGTGIGVSITANKVKGIRCAVCSEPYSALMSREHNDCNMLALGGRVIGDEMAIMIVDVWLNAEAQGGRHKKRVDMIMKVEKDGELD